MSRSSLSQFPGAIFRALTEHFPHANRPWFRVKKMVLILDIESEFRRKPEFALARSDPSGVLDGCSQPRNQRPHQNLLIH
jgi:hypothetical protein